MNQFYLEPEQVYGAGVDGYFCAVDNLIWREKLLEAHESGNYHIHNIFNPVSIGNMKLVGEKQDRFMAEFKVRYHNHWRTLAENPTLARDFMNRPLPTLGLQALAYLCQVGFGSVFVVGMDFYREPGQRYAWQFTRDIEEALDSKHLSGGYEEGAHSLERDLSFLMTIRRACPGVRIEFANEEANATICEYESATLEERRVGAHRDIMFLVNEYAGLAGSPWPVINYAEVNPNKRSLEIAQLAGIESPYLALKSALDVSDHVVVNGLIAVNALLDGRCSRLIRQRRTQVSVYLHESEYVFEKYREDHPDRFAKLESLLALCHRVLLVSKTQQEYLARIADLTNVAVIYNNIVAPASVERRTKNDSRVVMVGSLQERKGVDLFSRVADLADERGVGLSFSWLGGPRRPGLYYSENVEWLGTGDSGRVAQLMSEAGIFLLASIDDPFPLSVLEGISHEMKVVCYKNTGAVELADQLSVVSVFEDYTPESALTALQAVIGTARNPEKLRVAVERFCDLGAFSERIESALAI